MIEISEFASEKNKEKSQKWIDPKKEDAIDNELDDKIGLNYYANSHWSENPIEHLIKHNKLRASVTHYKETILSFVTASAEEKSIMKILA